MTTENQVTGQRIMYRMGKVFPDLTQEQRNTLELKVLSQLGTFRFTLSEEQQKVRAAGNGSFTFDFATIETDARLTDNQLDELIRSSHE